MRGVRGLSLTETVVAIFLLSVAMLLVINLMHVSIRYQGMNRRQATGMLLAQKLLDAVRAWAWEAPGGIYNYHASWAPWQGASLTDPDFPGYTAQVDAQPGSVILQSPCTGLESIYAPLNRRLTASVVPVRVQVQWDANDPTRRVSLVSYVGEPPPRTPITVTVTRAGGPGDPVPPDGVVDFTVQASDANGAPISDLVYRWSVESTAPNPGDVPGLGTVLDSELLTPPPAAPPFLAPRDGTAAKLQHVYRRKDTSWAYAPGFCKMRARARVCGVDYWGESLVLLGP